MGSTIFWGVIVFGVLLLVLLFGYKTWRKNKRAAVSRRRAHHRVSADERIQIRYPEPENSADAPTQLGHSPNVNSPDARTVSKPSQNPFLEGEQTKIRPDQKVNPTEEQPQLPNPHKVNSADAPTQVGREPINKIAPEDDRTIL